MIIANYVSGYSFARWRFQVVLMDRILVPRAGGGASTTVEASAAEAKSLCISSWKANATRVRPRRLSYRAASWSVHSEYRLPEAYRQVRTGSIFVLSSRSFIWIMGSPWTRSETM